MVSNWNGMPVEFKANSSYSCKSGGFYFEMDRDINAWNLSCVPGGTWAIPTNWPRCVQSKFMCILVYRTDCTKCRIFVVRAIYFV
jgi:hypothetical protein